jgi:hypothetical protein
MIASLAYTGNKHHSLILSISPFRRQHPSYCWRPCCCWRSCCCIPALTGISLLLLTSCCCYSNPSVPGFLVIVGIAKATVVGRLVPILLLSSTLLQVSLVLLVCKLLLASYTIADLSSDSGLPAADANIGVAFNKSFSNIIAHLLLLSLLFLTFFCYCCFTVPYVL